MGPDGARTRLRSFVLGGVVGASAVLATARRRRARGARTAAPGLSAFEGAPCYRELLDGQAPTGAQALDER